MIPPNAPARTTLRNASTYAPREGSPAGTSESPDSPDSPAPLLAGTSSIAPPLSQAPARNYSVALASSGYCSGGRQSRRRRAAGSYGCRLLGNHARATLTAWPRPCASGWSPALWSSPTAACSSCATSGGAGTGARGPPGGPPKPPWGPERVRRYSYEVRGTARAELEVTRTDRDGAVRD